MNAATLPSEPVKSVQTDEPQTTKSIEETICSQVLGMLGRPKRMFKITAINVGGSNYRVNAWCETPPKKTVKNCAGAVVQEECLIGGYIISDSFYVKVGDEGGIISSNPPIEKKY